MRLGKWECMQGGYETPDINMPYPPLLASSSSLITHSTDLRSNSAKLSRQRMSAPDASSATGGEAPGVSTAAAGCACTGVFAAATGVASALTMRRRPRLAAGAGPGRSSGVLGGIGWGMGEGTECTGSYSWLIKRIGHRACFGSRSWPPLPSEKPTHVRFLGRSHCTYRGSACGSLQREALPFRPPPSPPLQCPPALGIALQAKERHWGC